MLRSAALIDDALRRSRTAPPRSRAKLPADPASQSLFRRNRGPKCVAPATEKDPQCSAIPGAPKPIVDSIPPSSRRRRHSSAQALEKRKDAKRCSRRSPSVREQRAASSRPCRTPTPTRTQMTAIATELNAAADAIKDAEGAAARRVPARGGAELHDERLGARRRGVGEDERRTTRSGTCASRPTRSTGSRARTKAGFHVTFARINQGSLEWQEKLDAGAAGDGEGARRRSPARRTRRAR